MRGAGQVAFVFANGAADVVEVPWTNGKIRYAVRERGAVVPAGKDVTFLTVSHAVLWYHVTYKHRNDPYVVRFVNQPGVTQ